MPYIRIFVSDRQAAELKELARWYNDPRSDRCMPAGSSPWTANQVASIALRRSLDERVGDMRDEMASKEATRAAAPA